MKRRFPFHPSVLLMAILTFSMPFVTFAQQTLMETEQMRAIADAERDAEARVNKSLWFGVGCLTLVIGTVLAYNLSPSPPIEQLIGKSPEYVAFYTEAYQAKAKSIQGHSALTGCILNIAAQAVVLFIGFATHPFI